MSIFPDINLESTPISQVYETCLKLEAENEAQEQVQEQCLQGLQVLIMLELAYEAEPFFRPEP